MAVIGKKDLILQEEQTYFQKFISRNGKEYGLRFGIPNDANAISMMFKEIYGYKYINPLVYDVDYIKQEIRKPNNFWLVGELLDTREIAGVGLIEKKRYIAHSGKGMTRKKFQGKGVTTKIGAAGLISITKMPQFKDVLKIDTEVRGPEVRAQKLNQNAGAIDYGLIPAYINLGDKRHFKISDNTPFPPKQEEAAFLYSIILGNFNEKQRNLSGKKVSEAIEVYKKENGKYPNDLKLVKNLITNKNILLSLHMQDMYLSNDSIICRHENLMDRSVWNRDSLRWIYEDF